MGSVNPSVIPRNHKVEEGLQAAGNGDLQPFRNLLEALEKPYEDGDHLTPYQSPRNRRKKSSRPFAGPEPNFPSLTEAQHSLAS